MNKPYKQSQSLHRQSIMTSPDANPKPAQFAMSNNELRRAIQDTSEAITKLYNGEHKTALQKHLISLLDAERKRAELIAIAELQKGGAS